ncbi:MAG: hypothetical protein V4709_14965 [Pseudomonadota bacterium]
MSERGGEASDSFAPEADTQRAMLLAAIVSGVLLLVAHEAIEDKAAWFAGGLTRTLWFSLATAPTLLALLTAQQLNGRLVAWLGGYSAVIAYLAWYAGRAIAPAQVEEFPVLGPYACVLVASGHVAAAWMSCALARTGFAYARLFEAAWRHVSTLAQVLAYVGAFWLLLFLWAALFKALKVEFFAELFDEPRFIYPVTSLMMGFGFVIARTRSSIGDAVHLRVLSLWRGLMPLAATLALAFAAALLVQGVQPLWDTRHAAQLLLSLIVALVVLANAYYGKGTELPPHPVVRRLAQAALLLLPLFAGLAAWALALRWQQYGVSLDRLWAGLSVSIASLYALGYAVAALRREGPFLAGIAPVNRIGSLISASLLVLTQTGVLDFRAITAHALRDRAAMLEADDLRYLRWELGSPGVTALQAVQQARAVSDPVSAAAIGRLLAQERRYSNPLEDPVVTADVQFQQPAGAVAPPAALLTVLRGTDSREHFSDPLDTQHPPQHWLFELELDGLPPAEWLRVVLPSQKPQRSDAVVLEVFQRQQDEWRLVRREHQWLDDPQLAALEKSVRAGEVVAIEPLYKDVVLGGHRMRFSNDVRP